MPHLNNLDLVPVRGRYVLMTPGTDSDGLGSPATGQVTFQPSTVLYDADTEEIVLPRSFTAHLDEHGEFNIDLPATDDPDLSPTGWTYRVEERVDSRLVRPAWRLAVPLAAQADGISMVDVAPSTPAGPADAAGVSQAAFLTEVARLDSRIDAAGMWQTISDLTLTTDAAAVTIEDLAGYSEVEVRWQARASASGSQPADLLVTVDPAPDTYTTTSLGRQYNVTTPGIYQDYHEIVCERALPGPSLQGSGYGTVRLCPSQPGMHAIRLDWSCAHRAGIEVPATFMGVATAGSDPITAITLAAPPGEELLAGSRITVVGRI